MFKSDFTRRESFPAYNMKQKKIETIVSNQNIGISIEFFEISTNAVKYSKEFKEKSLLEIQGHPEKLQLNVKDLRDRRKQTS